MMKKQRTIALGTVAIAAVIVLFATGPEVAQVWSQAANAQEGYVELEPVEKHLLQYIMYQCQTV